VAEWRGIRNHDLSLSESVNTPANGIVILLGIDDLFEQVLTLFENDIAKAVGRMIANGGSVINPRHQNYLSM
jgi:hypothetical protein